MYQEKIVDAITGEIIFRPYTDGEIADLQAAAAQAEQDRLAAEAEAATKAAARQALLDKLGITQEEAALLLS